MSISQLSPSVQYLMQQLIQPQPMRRGSLAERYIQCSKIDCVCTHSTESRHGPYFNLTCKENGRTKSRLLTPPQAERVRTQIDRARQFRKCLDDYWDACERWADAQLEESKVADEAAKKGASKKPLKRPSAKKSKHF